MESHAHYTLVGSVVMVVLLVVAVILVWLSGTRDKALLDWYRIDFRQFSLSGLQQESPVTMRGIRVGKVESIRIDSEDVGLVEVVVSVQNDTPVKTDTEAVIERNLLTGLASIDLVKGSREAALLASTVGKDNHPVIPEGKTSLGALQENIPQLTERVSQLVTRLSSFFTPENQYAFSSALHDLQGIASTLNSKQGGIAEVTTQLSAILSDLKKISSTLDAETQQLVASLAVTSEAVKDEAGRLGSSLSSTASDVSRTLRHYDNPQNLLVGPPRSSYGPGESP